MNLFRFLFDTFVFLERIMPVPQPILDSLNTVSADADATAAAVANKTTTASALANAQHDDDQAAASVTAAQTQQAGDLAALETLIDQTYGVPPAPAAK